MRDARGRLAPLLLPEIPDGDEPIRVTLGEGLPLELAQAGPGLGMTAIQAIEREDLILLQAIVFTVAITVVLINILMDMAYTVIDPRLKLA